MIYKIILFSDIKTITKGVCHLLYIYLLNDKRKKLMNFSGVELIYNLYSFFMNRIEEEISSSSIEIGTL